MRVQKQKTISRRQSTRPGITIRLRLLYSFALVALLPAIAISLGSIALGFSNGRQQVLDRLNSIASLKELEISTWLDARHNELVFLSNSNYNLDRIQTVLKLSSQNKFYPFYFKALQNTFLRLVADSEYIADFSLIDVTGNVVLSTNELLHDQSFAREIFFTSGRKERTAQLIFRDAETGKVFEVNAIPIPGLDGENVGVLISRCNPFPIAEILRESTGLGAGGKAYLVTAERSLVNADVLTGATPPGSAQTANMIALSQNNPLPAVYADSNGIRVIGGQRWMSNLRANLVVSQDMRDAFATIFTSLGVNLAIALLSLFLAITLSLAITRSISTPLIDLSKTAASIAAGDLDQVVQVKQHDEIGGLAESFNSMTRQLRDLINGLERRVQDRTRTLQQRALQLETSSQVSREITSILDIDTLLERIVERICVSFGYYNVNIFLMEKDNGKMSLRASSHPDVISSIALEMNSTSLNGKAAVSDQPVLVNDVLIAPEFFNLEYLPDTRAELVIPLRIGKEVIGTLDVQSREPDAFTSEDVLVIQSLGDQIAIAIENARLYKQSQRLAIVEERNRLARDMHDSVTQSLYSLGLLIEGWRQMSTDGGAPALRDVLNRTAVINQQALREMRLLIHELRPPILEKEGLVNALQKRLDAVESRAGVHARLLVDEFSRLPASIEEGLYRIASEALNNALKHSQALNVVVRIFIDGSKLCLAINDDGCGFDPQTEQQSGGIGLASMQERAKKLDASFNIKSKQGSGTTIQVCTPCWEKE